VVVVQNPTVPKNNSDCTKQSKASNGTTKQTPAKPTRTPSSETKQNKWSYASEDVASIERNKKRSFRRERTPSTDSAPESSSTTKRRVKTILNVKASEKQKPLDTKGGKMIKLQALKAVATQSPQQNKKHIVAILKSGNDKVLKIVENVSESLKSENEEQTNKPSNLPTDISISESTNTDMPGFCEYCGEEYAYLNLHMETKHKNDDTEVSLSPPATSQNTPRVVDESTSKEEAAQLRAQAAAVARHEALQIVKTVKTDALIQKFGVRLLGMSLYPKQKIMTVSQRMIELVRLLRAAQGFDPNIQCLAQLMHCDYWPVLTEAIMYVGGYQPEEGTFRNPVFVFDVGQALKFSAYLLKTEATQNNNFQYEQELKDFMNSVDGKIQEILPSISDSKHFHFMDTQIHVLDSDNMKISRTEEVSEDRQVHDLLNDISATQQCTSATNLTGEEFILSEVLEQAVTSSVQVVSSCADEFAESLPAESQYTASGVQQASLLLGLSRAQPSSSSAVLTPVQKYSPPATNITKLPPVTTIKPATNLTNLTNMRVIKTEPHESDNVAVSNKPPIRFVKIVSSKSVSDSSKPAQRKFCLLIPSQTVQKPELTMKSTLQNIGSKITATTSEASPKDPLEICIVPKTVRTISENECSVGTLKSMDTESASSSQNPNLATLCGIDLDPLAEDT
jgi:hypothetical protein